jgi:signal transduction histidine kinase
MSIEQIDEQRLRRLLEVGRGLVSELDPEAVLLRVLEVAREITTSRYAALGILDARRESLERFLVSGIDDDEKRVIGDLPRGHGILGELIRRPEPLRLDDLSQHPRSYGFPPGHPPMTTFLGVPILIRGEAWGNLYLTEKQDGEFDEQDQAALTVLAEWAAIAIGNARLYADIDQRRKELERAVRGLEATTTIAKAVGGETDLDRVLELIVKRARALVEARSVVILLVEGDQLVVRAGAGHAAADASTDVRIPIGDGGPAKILETRRAERLADIPNMVRPALGELTSGAEAALIVPLVFRAQSSGLLLALDRAADGPSFDAEDERLLSAFAASAATAVATAQTVEAQRLRDSIGAAEKERSRWSRELHDETLQGLGALQVMLSTANRRPGGAEAAIEQAVGQIAEEIEKLQALITELRPAALDEIGLAAALTSLAGRTQALYGYEADMTVDLAFEQGRAETRLLPEVESTVYRIVQEGLTNAGKHAGASTVAVGVVERGQTVEVSVSDDGVGFDVEAVEGGFGLIGMTERLGLVDGALELRSEPGKGTTVAATVPARRAQAEPAARTRAV